jgi:uncharacterized protein (TIGR02246 family)
MTSTRLRILLACALVLPVAGACGPADDAEPEPAAREEPATESMPADLRAASDRYLQAWNADDPDAVAELYAEDATAVAYGNSFHGRDEIERSWLANVHIITDLDLTERAVRRDGDDWRVDGRFALTVRTADTDPFVQTGDYRLVWTRDPDGQWRVRTSEVTPDDMAAAPD